jgi:hypothetical protein
MAKQKQHFESTVVVPLRTAWRERIDRKEALRRLAARPLTAGRRKRIADSIPGVIDHYLTFGNGFREFMRVGDKPARVLLMLPTRRVDRNTVDVACPMLQSEKPPSGRIRYLTALELHRFRERKGILHEDGVSLRPFKRIRDVYLPVDVSFLRAEPKPGHPGGSLCCDLCEIVHSILDIHHVDWLCCFLGDGCGSAFPPSNF